MPHGGEEGTLLRQTLVLAPVSHLHMEDQEDMQVLRSDGRQAGIGISQAQQDVRADLDHQLVRAVDDISHGQHLRIVGVKLAEPGLPRIALCKILVIIQVSLIT